MTIRLTPHVFALGPLPDVGECLARLARAGVDREHLIALDSAAGEPRRHSWIGFAPERLEPDEIALGIAGAARALRRVRFRSLAQVEGPFQGGFMGAFAYDLGVADERAKRPSAEPASAEPWGFPLVVGGIYGDFLLRRESDGAGWLVLSEGWLDGRPALDTRREAVAAALAKPAGAPRARCTDLARTVTSAEHQRRIECARAAIAAGEFYQVNLAHRFTGRVDGDPIDVYRRLRGQNPAPYMGYLEWQEQGERRAVCSSSPELLLETDRGRARTRPIKGTLPREAEPALDAAARARLFESAKDRAELAMIIDLERNDLGKLARPGGVRVGRWPLVASYAHVHHLEADVRARLESGVQPLDALSALFPGGSVTGAPKLRAMQEIAELERHGRGFFCGAMGFAAARKGAGAGSRAAFNLLIRTLLYRASAPGTRGEISFQVGGGITWSSRAADEDRETLSKAKGLRLALEGPP